jgi:hypothetical protein
MFISQNFPGTILEFFYQKLGRWFTPFMIVIQMTGPFYFVYAVKQLIDKRFMIPTNEK